jgi:hypothetical protein
MTDTMTWTEAKAAQQPNDWRTKLAAILYPNGIKHPQQSEWEWMMERVIDLRHNERESGEPFLKNRADGVDGHYCIARKSPKGSYYEFYDAGKWVSATSLVFYLGKATSDDNTRRR